jgi:chromosome segregation ATPase
MANLTHRDPIRSGVSGLPRTSTSDDTPRNGLVGIDDELREEMSRLAAANSELMKSIRARHESTGDVSKLRAENADLRRRLEEVEQLVVSLGEVSESSTPAPWEDRQREYESLLEEKSEVIRALHQKIQELQELQEEGDATHHARDARNNADMDEVEQLKAKLEDERQRLRDDEEALMVQMRDMEMAMARDRAELSRQRAELQRIHGDIMREVEQASRDTGLRDRLLALTRRPQDQRGPKTMTDISLPEQVEQKKQNSGLFRRLFGG